jgi:hypothetical protein
MRDHLTDRARVGGVLEHSNQRKEVAMRKNAWLALGLGLGLALVSGRPAVADVWDIQTENDNTLNTENELIGGSDQLHDLGALPGPAADLDWYRISQKPFSSYEVVADATSGDISDLGLELTDGAGAVLQSSVAVGIGYTRSLRFVNNTAAEVNDERIRVMSNGCTTDCGPEDVYRIRVTETTYWVPRFNNSGTQITVLLLQNPTNYVVNATVHFWSTGGVLINSQPFILQPKALTVFNTANAAPGVGGALSISHDGRYGDLAGKTVALEPSTGFSFDSPMLPRLH